MSYPRTWLTRKVRFGISVLLVALFFIISPLVVLYTTGYRYDFNSGTVEQTGVISIDVEPTDIQVTLNDVQVGDESPLRLANRAPGTYNITLSKPGYHNWEKDVTVASKQTTYIKDITLFQESELKQTSIGASRAGDTSYHLNPDSTMALIVETRTDDAKDYFEIYAHDIKKDEETLVARSATAQDLSISWSPRSSQAMLKSTEQNTSTIYLMSRNEPDALASFAFNAEDLLTMQWHNHPFNLSLFVQDGTEIFELTRSAKTKRFDLESPDTLWYIDLKKTLYTYNPTHDIISSNERDGITLVSGAQKPEQIIHIDENVVIAQYQGSFKVIQKNPYTETVIQGDMSYYDYDTDRWYIWSPQEVWTVFPDGSAGLVTRTSNKIQHVRPLDEFGVITLVTQDGIEAFNPGYHISHTLTSFSDMPFTSISASKKDQRIYLATPDNKVMSLTF